MAEADRVSIAEIAANSATNGKGRNKNGAGRIRIRLQDKQRALDSLARHLALYGKNAAAIAPPIRRRVKRRRSAPAP